MPQKRKVSKTFRRRRNRNPRNGGAAFGLGQPLQMTMTRHVMPRAVRTRLAYSIHYKISDGTALSADTTYFQFFGNSVFNPDLNVTGERYPVGVVQWANFFERYTVLSSRMVVEIQPANGIGAGESHCVIFAHPYTTALPTGALTVSDFVGQPRTSDPFAAGPISHVVRRSMNYSTSSMLSMPVSQVIGGFQTSGMLISSAYQPVSQWFWTIVFSNSSSLVAQTAQTITFTVEYDVFLFQLKHQTLASHDTSADVVVSTPETEPCGELVEAKSSE